MGREEITGIVESPARSKPPAAFAPVSDFCWPEARSSTRMRMPMSGSGGSGFAFARSGSRSFEVEVRRVRLRGTGWLRWGLPCSPSPPEIAALRGATRRVRLPDRGGMSVVVMDHSLWPGKYRVCSRAQYLCREYRDSLVCRDDGGVSPGQVLRGQATQRSRFPIRAGVAAICLFAVMRIARFSADDAGACNGAFGSDR